VSAVPFTHARMALLGLALGFVISSAGLSDWGEIHRMLTFDSSGAGGARDLRLVIAFGGAIAVALAGFQLLARRDEIPAKPFRAGTIPGAILFGAGWAIAGACPAAALVQIGEGKAEALVTFAGVLAGTWLHDLLRKRLGWARHSCVD
jgi:uncharacterized membrane protein YedE/YeeE